MTGTGTFQLDSLNMWDLLTGANLTHPRTEMVIGQLKGGAMVHGDMKFINGTTFPDWWYRHDLHSFFLFPFYYYYFFDVL